jgi:hypothetical protein
MTDYLGGRSIKNMTWNEMEGAMSGLLQDLRAKDEEIQRLKDTQVETYTTNFNESFPEYLSALKLVDEEDYILIPLTSTDIDSMLFPTHHMAVGLLSDDIEDNEGSLIDLDSIPDNVRTTMIEYVIRYLKEKLGNHFDFDSLHAVRSEGGAGDSIKQLIKEAVLDWYNEFNLIQTRTINVPFSATIPVEIKTRPYGKASDYEAEIKEAVENKLNSIQELENIEVDSDEIPDFEDES